MTRPFLTALALLLLAPALAAADEPVWRVTLELSADGQGVLTVKRTDEPPDVPDGESLKLGLPGTAAVRVGEGDVFLGHNLTRPGTLEGLFETFTNAQPRPGAGVTFVPRAPEGRFPAKTGHLAYGRKLALPLTISCDVAADEDDVDLLILNLFFDSGETVHTRLNGPWDGRMIWHADRTDGNGRRILIDSDRSAAGRGGVTHRFRLPRGAAGGLATLKFHVAQNGRNAPPTTCRLTRVTVRGDVRPSIGVVLDAVGATVLVKSVLPGSPAEGAGVAEGDILRTVNGTPPRDVAHAGELVAATPLGGAVELVVLRGPETAALTVPAR